MQWNPFINAFGAAGYIGLVVSLIHYIETLRHDTPDTLIDGVGFLSLLVFSVAVMGFLFFYRPAVMLVEGQREAAVRYFLTTLATFGVITVLAVSAVLFLQ